MTEIIPYNQKLKARARELRNNSTRGEILLWQELRSGKVNNLEFLRQKVIGNYIVDFYCPKIKLVIEIDGGIHDSQKEQDKFRQGELESLGIVILRFTEEDVLRDIQRVVKKIRDFTVPL